MLNKLKKNYLTIILSFLILYLIISLLSGERGLVSYFEKKQLLSNLENEEENLVKKISDLENKNSLLSDNLDLDFVEILIRDKFLYGKKNETTYIIENDEN
tara:strand:- start:324 stop:626 length:303 start_codon:yes stop_codon:yes gene_type:complete